MFKKKRELSRDMKKKKHKAWTIERVVSIAL